jgi:rSAM/selenodomain-associated transferase 1
MRRALVIVGKAPEAGKTKTRLIPPLDPAGAAELYQGFLLDCVDVGLGLGWERVSVVHPRGNRQALAELLPRQINLLEQPGQGLQDALSHAIASHLAEGFLNVVVLGSDSPTLPAWAIDEACSALDTSDLSIGPTVDGGYYLLGLREPHLAVFEAIDWSTPRVYAQTLAHAHRLKLRVHAGPMWYDVDEPADLERLEGELDTCPAEVAPHTRGVLARIRQRPVG